MVFCATIAAEFRGDRDAVGRADLVERLLGSRLVELSLVGGRIDLGQDIAALDVLSLLEAQAEDAAVDLRSHGDRVAGLGRADAVEMDGHVGNAGLGGDDGDGGAVAALLAAAAADLLLHRRHHRDEDDHRCHGGKHAVGNNPFDQGGHLASFRSRGRDWQCRGA
jgi:hypothetical protein